MVQCDDVAIVETLLLRIVCVLLQRDREMISRIVVNVAMSSTLRGSSVKMCS